MNFLKKNKIKILGISAFIIFVLSIFTKSIGVEVRTVDFKYAKVKVNCLNVRCGPGVQYNKIGKIYKDDYIEIFAQIGDWYMIKTNKNYVGTVYKDYVEAISEEEVSSNVQNNVENSNIQDENDLDVENEIETNATELNENNEEEIILNVANIEFGDNESLTQEEQEFLNLINANRENNDLPKLEIDNEIQNIARLKAKDIVENGYFAHVSPVYGDINAMLSDFNINYKTVGENIAGNNNLIGAVEAWMNSENHKVNLLSKDYNYTGIAVVESETYGKVFVQIFVGK